MKNSINTKHNFSLCSHTRFACSRRSRSYSALLYSSQPASQPVVAMMMVYTFANCRATIRVWSSRGPALCKYVPADYRVVREQIGFNATLRFAPRNCRKMSAFYWHWVFFAWFRTDSIMTQSVLARGVDSIY